MGPNWNQAEEKYRLSPNDSKMRIRSLSINRLQVKQKFQATLPSALEAKEETGVLCLTNR